ncbi:MAG: DUF4340 domain-containing protein [Bacteroidetes bacterium]|nr:DUF4340 domain-containing protein [Bacteroidota bacterium]
MFRKIDTKLLIILFAVLIVIVGIVLIYDHNKGERTFKSDLFTVDSAKVTAITIYPKGKDKSMIRLAKTGKSWEIKCNTKSYPADTNVIQNLLRTLSHVKPERVSGTDQSSWKELEITDSSSAHVVVEQGKQVTADFRLGKISFTQNNNMPDYGGNRNISIKSHIRVAGDDRVYVVNGYVSGMFGDQPSMYRNRNVFRINKSLLTKLTFIYPGDSSFILLKSGDKWLVNDQPADSAGVETWLNSVANTSNSEFADDAPPFPHFTHILKMEGNSMPQIDVNGLFDPNLKRYLVRSSFNPVATFWSGNPRLFNQVFPSKARFETKKEQVEKKTRTKKKAK